MYKTRQLTLCALFAALTAAGALIRIPVGYAVFTLQFFFTALAGILLGAKWGAISQLLYAALGFAGLPLFGSGGGISYFLQPTCGFVLALPAAAWIIGRLCSPLHSRRRILFAGHAGLLVLYAVGFIYLVAIFRLYLRLDTPIGTLAALYLLPYYLFDCGKLFLCALLAQRLAHNQILFRKNS